MPIPNFSPLIHSLKNALLTIKWFAYANPFISIGVLLIIGYLGVPRVIDGFSSPEIIRKSCLEESKVVHRYRVGAICFDGSRSGATGRGACSWHGGVREWVYREKVEFKKTRQECMKYAIKRSWID